MKDRKKRKRILFVILITLCLIGISYAWLRTTIFGKKGTSITAGNLELILTEEEGGLSITDARPVYDNEGKQGTAFHFSLENTGSIDASYQLYLDNDEKSMEACSNCTFLEDKNIKYQLNKKNQARVGSLAETRMIDVGTIDTGSANKIDYELVLWLSINAGNDAMGGVFYGKLRVEAVQDTLEYDPDNTNANAPVLVSNMIPVKYDGYRWVKAENNRSWYNYDQQVWANAVTVSEESRSKYLNASTGVEVKMDDINTMWVWIPRYSYTIGSENGSNYYGKKGVYLDTTPTKALPGEIDLKFVDTTVKDTGNARYKVGEEPTNWKTPDGFTFGDKELSGVWVAKFETSNQEASYTSDNSNLTPIVKPKVTSWRGARVSTMETVAMNMTKANNIYGLSSSEVDSHMMKNSEWSLVAYLSQSKYGKLGNRSYTGANKEIYINNYNGHKTGCSAGAPSTGESITCSFEYDNLTDRGKGTGSGGGGASTTGNIYGIYDMSGGSWEYVMGNYNNYSGYTSRSYTIEEAKELLGKDVTSSIGFYNSGYSGPTGYDNQVFEGIPFPESKYYDLYTTSNTSTACSEKVCTSHALSEVAGWYGDFANMVNPQTPWLHRGGGYWSRGGAGVFNFNNGHGNAYGYESFRLVLTP